MKTGKYGVPTALTSFAAVMAVYSHAYAQVTPDGTTVTSANVAGTGKVTVDIAPKNGSGTSLNRYTDFNVSTAGLDLNNAVVGARTIINEVTSSNPSLIQGQIQVLGPRAHVIIANPNGITVDGGSFVNTGGVALATGTVSFVTRTVAPGETQENTVLTTTGGMLTIGAGGLSGAMSHLELISKQLQIQGTVNNTHSSSSADIRATAGDSSVELDAGVFPTNVASAWSATTSGAVANAGAVLVDITRPGGLSASKVQIAVTDTGAGVRSLGALAATANDFTLAATGDVRLAGSVSAGRDLVVDATSIAVQANADGTGASLTSVRHMDLLADSVDIRAATLRAGTGGPDGDITLGRSGVAAAGDFTLAGVQGATAYTMASITAPGGLGIYAQGRNITVEGASVAVDGAAELVGADTALRSTVDGGGVVQESKLTGGQTTLTATGAVTLAGFELAGTAGLSVNATSLTAAEVNGADLHASNLTSSMGNVSVTSAGAVALTGTDVTAGTDIKMTGTTIAVDAAAQGSKWRSGSVSAQSGGLVLKATAGGISNRGNTLQGKTAIVGDADSLGGTTLTATGNISNRSLDQDALGIVFASTGDLVVNAGGTLENYAGRLISNANVTLSSTGDFSNYVTKTGGSGGTLVSSGAIKTGFWNRLFGGKSESTSSVDYGSLTIPGTLAYVVANGNVGITAANLRNVGGEIDANNGSITIATGALTNEALATGRASVQVNCGFTCRTTPSGNVSLQGGAMSASQDITVNATGQVLNRGGSILAMREISITAPSVRAESITTWRAVAMPGSVFQPGNIRLLRTDQGGTFQALGGLVRLNTVDPVVIQGGVVDGSLGEEMPAGALFTAPVVETGVGSGGRPIGLFH
ncbi:MAG: filamentous hemagglutinin N-terminal domain-containing protein [Rhodospirillaceae bacterium]|nr:filamentous hemagglutinin N-terminal domain-containing protein [Rhodospirillales bacterium]